jgi:hypothetical protein
MELSETRTTIGTSVPDFTNGTEGAWAKAKEAVKNTTNNTTAILDLIL